MPQHITLTEYGQFLGTTGNRLVIKNGDTLEEYALNRIKTIQIAKVGVTFSSDLILECAVRGIKLFVLDFRGQTVACLSGVQQHAVVNIRKKQFEFLLSPQLAELCAKFIYGKCRNQRATLLYFRKYMNQSNPEPARHLYEAAEHIKNLAEQIKHHNWPGITDWRNQLLGYEGASAQCYWQALKTSQMLPDGFTARAGRNADDIVNQALNYGYAILTSYVWHCLINAGLEVYAGCLHNDRAGKPSLVLDLMEEYRAWTVDRIIIKHRQALAGKDSLTPALKKLIIQDIHKTFATRYPYNHGKMHLESILQRQIYHLAGTFAGSNSYKPYRFRW